MTFLLRIYFLGLIAFVPNQDGTEVTVFLLDARQGAPLISSLDIGPHEPLILARGNCTGDCGQASWPAIAADLAPHLTAPQALSFLEAAISGGGAWRLDDSEIAFQPTTRGDATNQELKIVRSERGSSRGSLPPLDLAITSLQDFNLVADLSRLVPDHGTIDPTLIAVGAADHRIVATLKLTGGRLRTRTVFQVDGEIVPVEFRTDTRSLPQVAVADSVMLEIEIEGPSLEIMARNALSGCERRMLLAPNGSGQPVELAVLNSPLASYDPAVRQQRLGNPPQPGHHFALYYELAQAPAPAHDRPLPYPGDGERHSNPDRFSDPEIRSAILDALGLNDARGAYDRILCPIGQLGAPPGG